MSKLIIIEGLDGSGKSTQVARLHAFLEEKGEKVRQIKLPDYEHPSSTLVKMYLAGEFGKNARDVNAYAASLLYTVDRFASFRQYWQDDYESDTVILADRYATSNAVHQMVKLPRSEWEAFLSWSEDLEYKKVGIPKPDLVIFLDMPVEVSQKLMTQRYQGDEVKKDVHEADVAYLNACRETAYYTAEKQGWHIIHCGTENGTPRSINDIHNEICSIVREELSFYA